MKLRTTISRCVLAIALTVGLLLASLIGLSYFDVRSSVGPKALRIMSMRMDYEHILAINWCAGYIPDSEIHGQYVIWTLKPFRRVMWMK